MALKKPLLSLKILPIGLILSGIFFFYKRENKNLPSDY